MEPKKIYLIRHAPKCYDNRKNYLHPSLPSLDSKIQNSTLTNDYIDKIKHLLNDEIESKCEVVVFCSPLKRTRETYLKIKHLLHVTEFKFDYNISEFFGNQQIENENVKDLFYKTTIPYVKHFKFGESFQELNKRSLLFAKYLDSLDITKPIIIISHKIVIDYLEKHLSKFNFKIFKLI